MSPKLPGSPPKKGVHLTSITFRIPVALKNDFAEWIRRKDLDMSKTLRRCIIKVMKENPAPNDH